VPTGLEAVQVLGGGKMGRELKKWVLIKKGLRVVRFEGLLQRKELALAGGHVRGDLGV